MKHDRQTIWIQVVKKTTFPLPPKREIGFNRCPGFIWKDAWMYSAQALREPHGYRFNFFLATLTVAFALTTQLFTTERAHAQNAVGQVLTSKSIPESTVAIIDPETGKSSGGGNTDVKLAPGDIISFKFEASPVPLLGIRGLAGYLTEYIPGNTEVVGMRITDANGITIRPRLPGMAEDSCGASCNGFNSVPCSGGTCNLADGSIAQVYADTGVFYATAAALTRHLATAFITMGNGYSMSATAGATESSNVNPKEGTKIGGLLGQDKAPYYVHNQWDLWQVDAYAHQQAISGNQGSGNAPFGYGSPVAGPDTHYEYEATFTGGNIEFNSVIGPWNRIMYPGSTIGTGTAASATGPITRMTLDASNDGFDVTPNNPLSAGALRFALGEVRVGEPVFVEVTLRVLNTPLDPVQGADSDCGEVFGGDLSSNQGGSSGAKNNPWPFHVPSPNCVYLNLKFDLNVDKQLATNDENLTYTLFTKNLSLNAQGNVIVKQKYDGSRQTYINTVGGTPAPTQTSNCDGDGLECLIWNVGTMQPSDELSYQTLFDIGGSGQATNVQTGVYTSTTLPGGFRTQALTVVKPTGVIEAQATITNPLSARAAGTNVVVDADLINIGTQNVDPNDVNVILPSGWTIVSDPPVPANLPEGSTTPIDFTIGIPIGTPSGIYPIDIQLWSQQSNYGPDYETYFREVVWIPVGQARTAPPVIDCDAINSGSPSIPGTSESNADIVLYFNRIERASGTASGTSFDVGGYTGTFGPLYGGLEVRATAQAGGKSVSELSEPCFVTFSPVCSDGFDNDNDGLTDFPGDPGCASPTDNDESDINGDGPCRDGLDNDGDGDTDWPDDADCDSLDDVSEFPQCSDGIDNDGDGNIDNADTQCLSSDDNFEWNVPECGDGYDNDADGLVDFPDDPGCHSLNDSSEAEITSLDNDPRLLVVFDTSGSMNWDTCNDGSVNPDAFTGGDGSALCPGSDVSCATCNDGSGTCGNGSADDSRIAKAKAGLSNVIAAYGEIEFGLMKFKQRAGEFSCAVANTAFASGGWVGAGLTPCSGFAEGEVLVGFAQENQYDMLDYLDGQAAFGGGAYNFGANPPPNFDIELRGTGATPLAGSLDSALTYVQATDDGDPLGNAGAQCRPYRVILLTDGVDTCASSDVNEATEATATSAAALEALGYDVYVIGFAVQDDDDLNRLNRIAAAGGTGNCSSDPTIDPANYATCTGAIPVTDEASLSAAIANIISETVLVEVCGGGDDDCDGLIDEGVLNACGGCGAVPTETCDFTDEDCDGTVDEGVRNACDGCGPTPNEACNGLDDDCDGGIDEGGVCPCAIVEPEVCDNQDNDCDGDIDEDLERNCGNNVGVCTTGSQSCTNGVWGACSGNTGGPETCNGLDDDCDGVVDGITQPCGVSEGKCQPGTEQCVGGSWGACVGAIGPDPNEKCDLIDNDCDGEVDEGNLGGVSCGTDVGICTRGLTKCVEGKLVCDGGTGPDLLETCDGEDDDCDGEIDEGNPDGGAACGNDDVGDTGICKRGALTCVGGKLECRGVIRPGTEICDGADNDCDGMTDEGNPEGGAECGDDVGECKPGKLACQGGELVCIDGVLPTDEVCDGLDNDCDGIIDDGIPVGAACGTDTGECSPGVNICVDGELICEGATEPLDEVCNSLDDDCDGKIDEGLAVGEACGNDEGACQAGRQQCVDGMLACIGEIPPGIEVCDCVDNDCDGEIDEQPQEGSLCPGESACVSCGCSLPCGGGEFAKCATGTVEFEQEGQCWCVQKECEEAECAEETVMVDDEVFCAPDTEGLPSCECRSNQCTFPCEGVVCTEPTVCEPFTGECVENNCRGLGCPDGQICDILELECVEDLCANVMCGEGEACRDGECEQSCATVECPNGQSCQSGQCVDDLCAGISCFITEVCDPTRGECIDSMCTSVMCPRGTRCNGLNGMCEVDPCTTVRCPEKQRCLAGECIMDFIPPDPDAGGKADGGGRTDANVDEWVVASGSGCSCATKTPTRQGWVLALLPLGLLIIRRRGAKGSNR